MIGLFFFLIFLTGTCRHPSYCIQALSMCVLFVKSVIFGKIFNFFKSFKFLGRSSRGK